MAHADVILVQCGQEVCLGRIGLEHPCDLHLVEALAKLQLTAQRRGWSLRLRNPSEALADLLTLTGLAEVLLTEASP